MIRVRAVVAVLLVGFAIGLAAPEAAARTVETPAVASAVAWAAAAPASEMLRTAASGHWRHQASYAYKSWCTSAGKFWVKFSKSTNFPTKTTKYRCKHYPSRAWNSRWQLDLYKK